MTKEQFLLIKLAEEATEIAQIALKTAQFGMDEKHPELTETNKERIHHEINDLICIKDMLNEECGFKFIPNLGKQDAKRVKVRKYYEYSKSLGFVK